MKGLSGRPATPTVHADTCGSPMLLALRSAAQLTRQRSRPVYTKLPFVYVPLGQALASLASIVSDHRKRHERAAALDHMTKIIRSRPILLSIETITLCNCALRVVRQRAAALTAGWCGWPATSRVKRFQNCGTGRCSTFSRHIQSGTLCEMCKKCTLYASYEKTFSHPRLRNFDVARDDFFNVGR